MQMFCSKIILKNATTKTKIFTNKILLRATMTIKIQKNDQILKIKN